MCRVQVVGQFTLGLTPPRVGDLPEEELQPLARELGRMWDTAAARDEAFRDRVEAVAMDGVWCCENAATRALRRAFR